MMYLINTALSVVYDRQLIYIHFRSMSSSFLFFFILSYSDEKKNTEAIDSILFYNMIKLTNSYLFTQGKKMKAIDVQTQSREAMIDLTSRVRDVVSSSNIKEGICLVYVPHTTAGITINENADPCVGTDIISSLEKVVLDSWPYAHSEGNSPAHVKASLIGSSIQTIVENGHLVLGTWQGIFFCEFDGPRKRKVYVKIQPINK